MRKSLQFFESRVHFGSFWTDCCIDKNIFILYFIWLHRLLDVVPSDKKLFLVFEYLDKDLKKYMDSAPAGGISLSLVKVILIFHLNLSPLDSHLSNNTVLRGYAFLNLI